ncbi:hypothetical protein KHP60_04625 [Microvirga sp. 3-52]|uniref:PD-(D/E)XK nuclease domain-containing protein n=1 Tax=Microvirga sp. 3-52 TaxID=2792425 RepID=UPI001BD17AA0|nr:hypothetical protein [Microvirga sp. 3-52]MBS7451630.1 hypothetical protein [Microvirga sp. 3-52]
MSHTSGYHPFPGSDLVVQTIRDIYYNLEETYADLSVPSGFVTPDALVQSWNGFRGLLERKNGELAQIRQKLIETEKKKQSQRGYGIAEWNDLDYLPEPLIQAKKVCQETLAAVTYTIELYNGMQTRTESEKSIAEENIIKILQRFHRFYLQIKKRHAGRQSIQIDDEYDVQDILHAILRLEFDDIREEEYTPSYAGGSSRVDFLIKASLIAIEVKKTRSSLKSKQVGEELIIDIARYKSHPSVKTLICFVYDPEHYINNPHGIENDLSKSHDDLSVRVIISPKP